MKLEVELTHTHAHTRTHTHTHTHTHSWGLKRFSASLAFPWLDKWLSVPLRTKWFWVQITLLSLCIFLDSAEDCSLGQCLTSSRAEISKIKHKKGGRNEGLTDPNRDRNDLFYSNVVDRPVKLACFIRK